MADTLTETERSQRMALIHGKDTGPELAVRKMIYGMGYRYRLHDKRIPGKPDLVFVGRKKAIFVHGCFWHRHPDITCKLARMPKSRLDFWGPKLERNRQRDEQVARELAEQGWQALTIWECQLTAMPSVAETVRSFLDR
ncbi:very short patch repair endonuclease [Terriglobus roseus]|uniref:Very short patch repair endonuclease n=1 Tax=Terriglobus roseus TaxID=392734 RepID=A0A1H4JD99_9BACT|nr:very short patch repair endonuclease [Terriglobus roseus]SEB44290.1 T/G mismatch-specific endonuclease [Terriglobus roseus]